MVILRSYSVPEENIKQISLLGCDKWQILKWGPLPGKASWRKRPLRRLLKEE